MADKAQPDMPAIAVPAKEDAPGTATKVTPISKAAAPPSIPKGEQLTREDFVKARNCLFFVALVVVAGIVVIGMHKAAQAMELGFDGILLNTAVAKAQDPVKMAAAFGAAIRAGQDAHQAGLVERRDMAAASTPVFGLAQFS